MGSKVVNKMLFCIIVLIIIGSLSMIIKHIDNTHSNYLYKEIVKKRNNILLNYPYFKNKKIDNQIQSYLNSIDNDEVDEVKYLVNYVDNYISILFTKYYDNKIVNYDSFIYNIEGNIKGINDIVSDITILQDKIKIYLDNNNILINNYPDVIFNYFLKDDEMEVILTNKEGTAKLFTTVNINYHEIYDILYISFEIDNNYTNILTTTTATTTTTTTTTTTQVKTAETTTEKEDNGNKVIAFTFDDGPSKYTSEIMDVLVKYGAKATFFEVGYMIKVRRDTVKEVIDRGFEVGNHTTDHSNLNKLSTEKIKQKIYDNNDLFKEITGFDFPLLRPPYGNCNSSVKALIDVPIIMWSVDSRDWESRNADEIVRVVTSETKSGDIVLFHDLYPETLAAIEILVPYYYEQGYKIVGVSELFTINNKDLIAGTKYYHAKS